MLALPASSTTIRAGVTATIRYWFRPRNTKMPVSAAIHWLAVCAPKIAWTGSPG
jgi:hypothetical protein